MRELEKDVMCVLLQSLRDRNLITQEMHDQAKNRILATLDAPAFFWGMEYSGEGDADGHTQNSC